MTSVSTSQSSHGFKALFSGAGQKIGKGLIAFGKSLNSACDRLGLSSKKVQTALEVQEIGAAVFGPIYLAGAIKGMVTFSRGNPPEVAKQVLEITDDLREAGESVATFAGGLGEIGAVSTKKLRWIKPFSGVLMGLSVISMVLSVWQAVANIRVHREMKAAVAEGMKDGKFTLDSFDKIVGVIEKHQNKDDDFIKNTFGVTETQLWKALFKAEDVMFDNLKSGDVERETKGQEQCEQIIKKLMGRVKHNIASSIVSTVSSVIAFVAGATLLACPVLPVGWGLMALSATLDIGNWIGHRAVDFKFVRDLGIHRTKWQWLKA